MLDFLQHVAVGFMFLIAIIWAASTIAPQFTYKVNGIAHPVRPVWRIVWFLWCAMWAYVWWTLFP